MNGTGVMDFGLDRLLARLAEEPSLLAGRRWALLGHGASVTRDLEPAHLALSRLAGPPTLLLAPEHGYYGVEQDMVAATARRDPWTGAPIHSLYDGEASLIPRPELFEDVDLVLLDIQDVGSRYYTYVASAVWTAEAALAAGAEVWVLDRPNPLGGVAVEGALVSDDFHSFVGAFRTPARHGLSPGEIVLLEARRRSWNGADERLSVWRCGASAESPEPIGRNLTWDDTGRPWIAPSPNMPQLQTAWIYPGLCLLEATTLSEGRGTTRPFHLIGAPGIDPKALAEGLAERLADQPGLAGLRAVPTYFRPQFQKHAGEVCGGVELVLADRDVLRPYRAGVEILAVFSELFPEAWDWRSEPYEFVTDRPAIDLLTGSSACREALEAIRDGGSRAALDAWIATWPADEEAFLAERESVLLYPQPSPRLPAGICR